MTELAVRDDSGSALSPASMDEKIAYAKTLAASELLPKSYKKQPANVLLAIELGAALGIPPIQAMTGIHVVEGKPVASAELIASLVRRAGHILRVQVDESGVRVKATLIRSNDPDFEFVAVWDMKKAQTAGLTGKDVWKKYPTQMLRNRAITEVARMGASDVLYGVSHTAEEFEVRDLKTHVQAPRITAADILDDEPEQIDEATGEITEAEVVETDDETWPEVAEAGAR